MPEKTFSRQIPAITASAGGSLAAFIAGTYLGVFGTVAGLFLGSVVSGTAAYFIERFQRRAAEFARMKAAAVRQKKGAHLSLTETQHIRAIVDQDVFGPKRDRAKRIAIIIGAAVGIAMVFGVVFIGAATLTTKAVSGDTPLVVRHHSRGTEAPVPTPTRATTITPSAPGTVSPAPSSTPPSSTSPPTATPTASSPSPRVSPSPSVSVSQSTQTP